VHFPLEFLQARLRGERGFLSRSRAFCCCIQLLKNLCRRAAIGERAAFECLLSGLSVYICVFVMRKKEAAPLGGLCAFHLDNLDQLHDFALYRRSALYPEEKRPCGHCREENKK
jgi:hypothetical protein